MGEVFGQCVDDIVRRPIAALVPLVQDTVLLAIVALSLQGVPALDPSPYRVGDEPPYAFAVPGALPSLTDLFDVPGAVLTAETNMVPLLVVSAALILAFAFLEAGFIGALKRIYVDPRRARLVPGALPDEPSLADGRRAFLSTLAARGPWLAIYRLALAALAGAATYAATRFPGFSTSLAGVLVIEGLLLFAPFAIALDGMNPVRAARRSLRVVFDHLATTLVALLFLFASTGAVAALVLYLQVLMGPAGLALGAGVYAFIGTALSLFVLRVYLGIEAGAVPGLVNVAPAEVARPTD